MNLYEAMDAARDAISSLDGRLSTLSYYQVNQLLDSIPNPTGVIEELVHWRLRILKAQMEEEG